MALTSQTGASHSRVLTITATNPGNGVAYSTQISNLSLIQVSGPPCRPVITPPSAYPVSLGDLPASSTMTTSFSVNFGRCSNLAQFILIAPWSSATYETGAVTTQIHP